MTPLTNETLLWQQGSSSGSAVTCPRLRGWLLAGSLVLQDGDVEGGAVRRSARTRLPPELYGDTMLDAVLGEVLELDTEGSGMDLCVFLWMLN